MKKSLKPRSTVLTVVAATVALVVFGGGTAVAGGLITSAKIKNNTIQSIDVKNNNLTGADIKDSSLTGADIANGSLNRADTGVHFAQINADATVANSSDVVTASQPSAGTYEVNFHFNVTHCTFSANVGDAGAGGTTGFVTQLTDRAGNPDAIFVRTTDLALTQTNKPFQLIVVC